MRVQKYIAAAGVCSRREAEERIKQGRVMRNGVPAVLGESVAPGDTVTVDGIAVSPSTEHTYIMLHKPRGYVTTLHDEKGRKTVAELIQDVGVRLVPVGRLDLMSEGLLLMTDDGELVNALTHPSREIQKTYRVRVHGANISAAAERLSHPVEWEGIRYCADSVRIISDDVLEITVHEGKKHEVRNMCAACGLKVERLVRTETGGISLGELSGGKWRRLTQDEIERLKNGG